MRRIAAAACTIAVATALAAGPAPAGAYGSLGPWTRTGKDTHWFTRSQGLATDPSVGPGVTAYSWMFGLETATSNYTLHAQLLAIPLGLLLRGYDHIGDVDSDNGKLYVPFEGEAGKKAFGIYDFDSLHFLRSSTHALEDGEQAHNSWVAVSPDGEWLLTGEWGEMRRFLVFPIDDLSHSTVEVAAEIRLDETVTDVQGCDFAGPTELVCLSDDVDAGRPLIQVDLAEPLGSGDVAGSVMFLGPAPQESLLPFLSFVCGTDGESEGVDVHAGTTLRLLVIDPCLLWVHEYTYERD